MAEARNAVAEPRVTNIEEDAYNTWQDYICAFRKASFRRYYRIRNSIRNGVWPTSLSNLGSLVLVLFILMQIEPSPTYTINRFLWHLGELLYLSQDIPRILRALIIAFLTGVVFFMLLFTVRLYILRLLLSYRKWMYEPMRPRSKKTLIWGIIVRLVSGYQPSLYSCQRSLPKMPVPSLQETISKLMESLMPICSSDELQQLKEMAEEFKTVLGPKLQRILILKSWWAYNYVSDWWEKYVYLMSRLPLAVNSNYYAMDQCSWTPSQNQASRAATLVHQCLVFKRMIDREELQPLLIRGVIPICMAQYERLFSSTRIPGEDIDDVVHFDSKDSKHIVVLRNGIYYKLDVFDNKNQFLSPATLEKHLEWIIQDADNTAEQLPFEDKAVAALTTMDRTQWAQIRKKYLLKNSSRETLDMIEKSICCVSLPDISPKSLSEKGKFLLHGDGKSIWFDKGVNIVVFANAQAGLNCEHSMADAPAMGHFWEHCLTKDVIEKLYTDDGKCMPSLKSFRQAAFKKPQRLIWELSPELAEVIKKAYNQSQIKNNDLDLVVAEHKSWGKGFIKECKVSPDAFIQLALQLAYFKESGKFALTYEASMTRLYQNGRTETVRSCTVEAVEFVRSMYSNCSNEDKINLLRKAANKHQNLYKDAMNGKGIDRHLFALYVASKGLGYESEFLKKVLSKPWTLSTSQQPQQQEVHVPDGNLAVFRDKLSPGGGFGPVSDDGYGVSYMLPREDNIFFHISSKNSAPNTDSSKFLKTLFEAMDDIRQLFVSK